MEKIKSRRSAVRFIEKQFADPHVMKGACWHYGKEAIRQLLDHIYGGKPTRKDEHFMTHNIERIVNRREGEE